MGAILRDLALEAGWQARVCKPAGNGNGRTEGNVHRHLHATRWETSVSLVMSSACSAQHAAWNAGVWARPGSVHPLPFEQPQHLHPPAPPRPSRLLAIPSPVPETL